ncbi:MAG: universal stress protein [Bacteroidota bacterium]
MLSNIKNIVHPTDFSAPAENAFLYATEIASKSEAQILVLHFVKPPYDYGSDELMEEYISKNSYSDLLIETEVRQGNVILDIVDTPADLIVMGAKGKTNMAKTLFGSITSEVIIKSSTPVLIVPTEKAFSDFNRIVFATDYNERDLDLLKETIAWAKLFDAAIIVLHVAEKNNLESDLKFRGLKELVLENTDYEEINFRLIFEKDFYTGMSDFLHGQAGEMLVLTRNKKSFIERLVDADHIQESMYAEVPLLVMPAEINP